MKCKVVYKDECYPEFRPMMEKYWPNYIWEPGLLPINGKEYEIVGCEKHTSNNEDIYLITDGKSSFMMAPEGIEIYGDFRELDVLLDNVLSL